MTRNVEMLVRAAGALGELKDEVVFVGGAVVDLFITDPAAPRPRFTEDVDVVVEVTTYAAWAAVGERLRALGFREDQREGAPLCRWLIGDLVVDVMPALERVLGFTNRWYRQAKKQSEERELPGGVHIRVATAPLFLATKIEAFGSRGRGDFVASHDLEDIIAVVDGRPAVADEVKAAPEQLRRFLASAVARWLKDPDFLAAVPGHLPGDVASQARAPVVLERLRTIAAVAPPKRAARVVVSRSAKRKGKKSR
jgi:predicted nucleotidyltransferase